MPDNVRGASEAFYKSMEEFQESMDAGDPVPSVTAEDVKRWWNARRQILNYLGIKGCKVEGTVGIDLESLREQNPSLQFDYPTPPAFVVVASYWKGYLTRGFSAHGSTARNLRTRFFEWPRIFPSSP